MSASTEINVFDGGVLGLTGADQLASPEFSAEALVATQRDSVVVNMLGGEAGVVSFRDGSRLSVRAGSIERINAYASSGADRDSVGVEVFGGVIDDINLARGARLHTYGGHIKRLDVGGFFLNPLASTSPGDAIVHGGAIDELYFRVPLGGQADSIAGRLVLAGGTIDTFTTIVACASFCNVRTISLTGSHIDTVRLDGGTALSVFARDFTVDGVPVPGTNIPEISADVLVNGEALLRGVFADGSRFSTRIVSTGSTPGILRLVPIPEPTAAGLLATVLTLGAFDRQRHGPRK